MRNRTIIYWDCLTEDMLWKLATDYREYAAVRQEAMQRWLYPADYGYSWAGDRLQAARDAACHCAEVAASARQR